MSVASSGASRIHDPLAVVGLSARAGARIALAGLGVLGWYVAALGAFRYPPPVASAILLVVLAAFVELHGRRGVGLRGTPEADLLSARHLAALLPRLAPALPALLLFCLAFAHLYQRLLDPAPRPPGTLDTHAAAPGGLAPVVLFTVVVGPTIEEFGFRGWIQAGLARRWPPVAALLAASLLFATAHAMPDRIAYFLVFGLIYGYAALATGSVLAGLLLHAAVNALFLGARRLLPSGPGAAWMDTLAGDLGAGAVLLVTARLLVRHARRLRAAPARGPGRGDG